MFHPARSHGRAVHAVLQPCTHLSLASRIGKLSWHGPLQHQRHWTKWAGARSDVYEAEYPAAEKLKATGIFIPRAPRGKKKAAGPAPADRNRVNIVNKKLADDVIEYIRPSLERHKGCDLISIYPGVGLFAKALHDAVQPRSHILLEPDEVLYTPFLKPLFKKDNVKLIPKSGIIWQELQQVLSPEHLPHQVEFDRLDLDNAPPRNDTLLVDMNLSMYPKKKYNLFDSVSRMVIYQLLQSIRTATQFQKYGQVRMLVWIPDDEKGTLLPRVVQSRKKGAVEAEIVTEYLAEVCGQDGAPDLEEGDSVKGRNFKVRPAQLDYESMRQAMVRMRDGGYVTPSDRGTKLLKRFKELGMPLDTPLSLAEAAFSAEKSFTHELADMEKQKEAGLIKPGSKTATRFKMLRYYDRWIDRLGEKQLEFVRRLDAMNELLKLAADAEAAGDEARAGELQGEVGRLNDEYNAVVGKLPDYVRSTLNLLRDQLHVLRQPPGQGPVMAWDRRPWEPLKVSATEFFPNAPCALLDIQPKATHPLLRHIGPGTTNAGDIFDLILTMVMQNTTVPLLHTMDHIWPGARDGLEAECVAGRNPARGGSPLTGDAAFACRAANEAQLMEMLEQFMRWPFRPPYAELVGRLEDDGLIDDSSNPGLEDEGPSMGNTTVDPF